MGLKRLAVGVRIEHGLRRSRQDKDLWWGGNYRQGIPGDFLGTVMLGLAKDAMGATIGMPEEVGGPEAMKFPPLAFVNGRAEQVPFHRIVGLTIAGTVAENSNRDLFRPLRMVQGQIDAKAVVAPMNIRANPVFLSQMIGEGFGEERGRAGGKNPHPRLWRTTGRG